MCASNTTSWMSVEPTKGVGNNTLREGTGCGWKRGHREVGQQFSGTNVLVLGPGDKHNTVQHKHRNEIEKRP